MINLRQRASRGLFIFSLGWAGCGTLAAQSYTSPYAITLDANISAWTADVAGRESLITNNTAPNLANWYNITAAWPQGPSWGPLIPQLYSVANPANTLAGVAGPVINAGAILPTPAGVDPYVYQRERLLAVANAFIGTPYQHVHDPLWNPYANGYSSNPGDPNYWPWQAVSNTTSLSPINGPPIPNPWAATYGLGTQGIDCSDFAAYVYDVALGIQLSSNVTLQGLEDVTSLLDSPAIAANGTMLNKTFVNSPNYGTGNVNLPGSLETTVFPYLNPGDLLFVKPDPNATFVSHVVIWLGEYGTLADGSNSTVPLVISSHDNTPPVFDLNGNISPPGVHVLPFTADNWFYQNFQNAMIVVPEPADYAGWAGAVALACVCVRRRWKRCAGGDYTALRS